MLIGDCQGRKNEGSWARVWLGGLLLLLRSEALGLGWCWTAWDFLLQLHQKAPARDPKPEKPRCCVTALERKPGELLQLEFNLWLRFILSLEIPGTVFYHSPRSEPLTLQVKLQHQHVYFYSSWSKLFMQKIRAGGGWRNNLILSYSSHSARYHVHKTFSINKLTSCKLLLLI